MVNDRKPKEIVLRITVEDGGRYGLALGPPGGVALERRSFSDGAFTRFRNHDVTPDCEAPPARDTLDMDRYFYRWGGAMASTLGAQRRRYAGDLDQFLLHMVFVLADLDMMIAAQTARAKGAGQTVARRCELNMQSLSDITGIPRESVRRKLVSLVNLELVQRTEAGLFASGPATDVQAFFDDLGPLSWGRGSARSVHP